MNDKNNWLFLVIVLNSCNKSLKRYVLNIICLLIICRENVCYSTCVTLYVEGWVRAKDAR